MNNEPKSRPIQDEGEHLENCPTCGGSGLATEYGRTVSPPAAQPESQLAGNKVPVPTLIREMLSHADTLTEKATVLHLWSLTLPDDEFGVYDFEGQVAGGVGGASDRQLCLLSQIFNRHQSLSSDDYFTINKWLESQIAAVRGAK